MNATETLRKDHEQIKRLNKIIINCYGQLYAGNHVPISDLEKITIIISEFLDSIHYSREENSYFACVASYGTLKEEIRKFMIEHEFGRRIAKKISEHLSHWKKGNDSREPVARFLRTYSIYLMDHISNEDKFFEQASSSVLDPEEEREMYEQFNSVIAITQKVDDMIKEIDYLEKEPWNKPA